MNKLIIVGNLTKDVELQETSNGTQYARFTVAVNRKYANADGEKLTDYFDITAWNKQAEIAAQYFTKGMKVGITARVEFREAEKEGVKYKAAEFKLEEFEFLSSRHNDDDNASQKLPNKPINGKKQGEPRQVTLEETDDDLPF